MDKSRRQFEEWIADNAYLFMHINLTYHEAALYKLWQASRESLEIELPECIEYDKEYRECDYEEGHRKGYNISLLECKNILISNGVKIKNESL